MVFVRKDLADSLGDDSDTSTGIADGGLSYGDGPLNQQSCAQAISGSLSTGAVGAPRDDDPNDFGGVVRRECLAPATAPGCDPNTCQVATEKANFHVDCRFKTEAKLPGIQDTVHPDRHFFLNPPPSASAPAAPPWHNYLDDTPTDNGGGASNSLVAGTGQTDETYDESGTFYICYKQDRDPTLPGYNHYQ